MSEAMEWNATEDAVSGEWWISGPDILIEDEQYAQLIAAAPELLDALKGFQQSIIYSALPGDRRGEFKPLFEAMHIAISKATRQPA